MTKKNNKMKMVKDPKTGKDVPEFAVKKSAGKMVKKKMMAGGKQVKKGYAAGKMVKKKRIDAKTQRLLDSSRKLGRRLISMDIQSEKKDKK